MLRCHDLPSDFHPLLLIVGERTDIPSLAAVCSRFAENGIPVALSTLSCVAHSTGPITISRCVGYERPGVFRAVETGAGLIWRMDKPTAQRYADELKALLDADLLSGSCFLELGYIDEIRVKVTFGEFDDSWLTGEKRV